MSMRSTCPISSTLDLIGDKWTMLIVRDLLLGARYSDELLSSREGIATNILSSRLKSLVEHGLVTSTPDKEDRRRVRYRLTKRGETLRSVARAMADWGLDNIPGTDSKR